MDIPMHIPSDLKRMRRGAAVVLPKDFGMVAAYTGIGRESIAAEGGTGTGFMAVQLARICKKVYSYEVREEHFSTAKSNLERLGIRNVELALGPIEELQQDGLDLIFLDFKGSDAFTGKMHSHLKEGGFLVGYCPNIEQAKAFHLGAKPIFNDVFTITSSITNYTMRDLGCRPDNFSMVHTAYLVFAKK